MTFAGTQDGIYRSTDEGNNWIETGVASSYVHSIAFDPGGNSHYRISRKIVPLI